MTNKDTAKKPSRARRAVPVQDSKKKESREEGGPQGLEPTRYGDWERKGRCIDF